MELSEFNIRYEPHGPIKAQCLLDFVNDLQQTPVEDQWTLHVDGSSNPRGAGTGIVLEGPNDILIDKSLHFAFKTSNNQAEYEAIIAGLSLAREVGVKKLTCKTDSKLTVGHLNDEFQIKDPILQIRWRLCLMKNQWLIPLKSTLFILIGYAYEWLYESTLLVSML